MADQTLSVRAGDLSSTSLRYHELALRAWLNQIFTVREGYPVPVVFCSPSDAFSQFSKLWADERNPFRYLLDITDASGTPIYEPHPSPVRYPLISVFRRGMKFRTWQNFSYHRWRRINWPTVSDDVSKCDLGNVTTSQMPMAWNYTYQVDHMCTRPDTQAFFVESLLWAMYRTGGGVPQTWMYVNYPGWGWQIVRLTLDGDIENATPETPADGANVEYRTTVSITVEGFSVDVRYKIYPALWQLLIGETVLIEGEFFRPQVTQELRLRNNNVNLDARDDVPDDTVCQTELADYGESAAHLISFTGTYVFGPVSYPVPGVQGISPVGGIGDITLEAASP